MFELFKKEKILKKVNEMIGWKLPAVAMGAFRVWKDKGRTIVDVETSDGGVSAIDYKKFLDKAVAGKVSQEAFCECFY